MRRRAAALDAAALRLKLTPERPRDPIGVQLDEAEAAAVRDLLT